MCLIETYGHSLSLCVKALLSYLSLPENVYELLKIYKSEYFGGICPVLGKGFKICQFSRLITGYMGPVIIWIL